MSSELLRIDEKWSVEYDPSNNDKPGRVLRYGEPAFGGSSDWKNDALAMFYALIDREARLEALEAENARLRKALDIIGEGRPENPVGDPWAFYDDLVSVARRASEGGNADV